MKVKADDLSVEIIRWDVSDTGQETIHQALEGLSEVHKGCEVVIHDVHTVVCGTTKYTLIWYTI